MKQEQLLSSFHLLASTNKATSATSKTLRTTLFTQDSGRSPFRLRDHLWSARSSVTLSHILLTHFER